jgi:threonine/homoserine/homoserine lactone efflux protein
MDWTLWAGFVVASLIVGLLPGPGVTSIVGYALTAGLRTALGSVFCQPPAERRASLDAFGPLA